MFRKLFQKLKFMLMVPILWVLDKIKIDPDF